MHFTSTCFTIMRACVQPMTEHPGDHSFVMLRVLRRTEPKQASVRVCVRACVLGRPQRAPESLVRSPILLFEHLLGHDINYFVALVAQYK